MADHAEASSRLSRLSPGIVFVSYGAIVAWLTWPLAPNAATHLALPVSIAHFDTLRLAWTLAWETHALTTAPGLLFEGNIYYPDAHALTYGQQALGMLLYFAPVQLLTGNPALALNVSFLVSVAMTAATLHWVVEQFTRHAGSTA